MALQTVVGFGVIPLAGLFLGLQLRTALGWGAGDAGVSLRMLKVMHISCHSLEGPEGWEFFLLPRCDLWAAVGFQTKRTF